MESLILKNVAFYPDKIILKDKGNAIIYVDEIDTIFYVKPSILNYFCLQGDVHAPSTFNIQLRNNKLFGSKEYILIIKYRDVLKIQKFFKKNIVFV